MKKKIKSTPPEPAFGLDMPFDEALRRFIGTDPNEVEAGIKKSKQKKPPGSKKARPPSGNDQSDGVVSLRHRRMRKKNTGR